MKPAACILAALALAQATPGQRRPESLAPYPEPDAVLRAEYALAGGSTLWPLAQSADSATSRYAIRAIGRLEDPANVPRLLALGAAAPDRVDVVATAVAQSLKGFDPALDPPLLGTVAAWMQRVFVADGSTQRAVPASAVGNVAYARPEQVHAAEGVLRRMLDRSKADSRRAGFYSEAVRALEALARLNVRRSSFDDETVARLADAVRSRHPGDTPATRAHAVAALVAARALTGEIARAALADPAADVRRVATAALAGGVDGLDASEQSDAIQRALGDSSGPVRYEAVRAYARRVAPERGCGPVVARLSDADSHVVLAALDALGDICTNDGSVTSRLAGEIRTPDPSHWHRATHAFVALAKRDPDGSRPYMQAFAEHPAWWVRMYAVQAAAAASDGVALDKLAHDPHANVRTAALAPLLALNPRAGEAAVVAAFELADAQLLRTASALVTRWPRSDTLAEPLTRALLRLTKEDRDTSRDARLPLLDAIAVHGTAAGALLLKPLLTDRDPRVAERAADVMTHLTGTATAPRPAPMPRLWRQAFSAEPAQCVSIDLGSGRRFGLQMDPDAAPIAVDRFLTLALRDRYYDGLTFHRVVPNFVIQGGGPGANEYASGLKDFMRDEIAGWNDAGSVGLSTRGRNTGDGQIFINLVDNLRLNFDYTVFAHVVSDGMTVVGSIEEGETIARIAPASCR